MCKCLNGPHSLSIVGNVTLSLHCIIDNLFTFVQDFFGNFNTNCNVSCSLTEET